jgi:hypothetical protein
MSNLGLSIHGCVDAHGQAKSGLALQATTELEIELCCSWTCMEVLIFMFFID